MTDSEKTRATPQVAAETAETMKEGSKRTEEVSKELRDKIRSKFQVTTFLAGFGFTILNAQIGFLKRGDQAFLLPLSTAVLTAAILLFVSAVMLLDGLMMPKVFWHHKHKPGSKDTYSPKALLSDFDPPYVIPKDLWGIKNRMVFYWTSLTIMAMILTFVATLMAIIPYSFDPTWHLTYGSVPSDQADRSLSSASGILQETLYFIGWLSVGAIVYVGLMCSWARLRYGPMRWD